MTQEGPDSLVRISVDISVCISNGMCCALAQSYFDMDDDGTLRVLRAEILPEDTKDVEDSVAACPVGAISIQR
jgi:ferredoxin